MASCVWGWEALPRGLLSPLFPPFFGISTVTLVLSFFFPPLACSFYLFQIPSFLPPPLPSLLSFLPLHSSPFLSPQS